MERQKKKILIIDDEASFTQMVKINLEETGKFEVHTVNDPHQAVTAARHFRPDLVLLDVIMPTMDGGDVAAKIKDDQELSNTPIVFLTAVVREEETSSGESTIGGHAFVSKPISVGKLIDCIEKHIG